MYFVDLIKKYIFPYRVTSSIELNDSKNKSGDENKSQALKINFTFQKLNTFQGGAVQVVKKCGAG